MAKGKDLKSRMSRRRLGRGLESLISAPIEVEAPVAADPTSGAAGPATATVAARTAPPPARSVRPTEAPTGASGESVRHLPIAAVHPDPNQPRRHFDEAALAALAESIRQAGVMQPIVVRPDPAGGHLIVAGERRWRAVGSMNIDTIPAIVREIDDQTAARWSLIENLQREDLNPIERADAFQRLAHAFGLTHQEIADAVGLDRTSVTNHLRLLDLDEASRDVVRQGLLSMGHARALLGVTDVKDRARLLRQVVAQGWSVRELERRVRQRGPETPAAAPPGARSAHMRDLERRLAAHLGTRVDIRPGRKKGSGTVSIDFHSLDEFEGLCERLGFKP